mmetsp:Transcript_106176/g.269672  ORF Transcript_106176/g.269672 Transcript_106176/m.269672 type:complete len:519 (+) Transcript_106176:244-1800(+)
MQVLHVLVGRRLLSRDTLASAFQLCLLLQNTLLLLGLQLGLLGAPRLLDLVVLHVVLEGFLVAALLCQGLGLHFREVCCKCFEDGHDTPGLICRVCDTGVARIPCGRCLWQLHGGLNKLPSLLVHGAALFVKVLEDSDGVGQGGLRLLSILNGKLVLLLADLSDLRGLVHVNSDLADHVVGLADFLCQAIRSGLLVFNLECEVLNLVRLVVDGGLSLVDLLVAPVLVIILLCLLIHHLEYHLLDHVDDLVEGPIAMFFPVLDCGGQTLDRIGVMELGLLAQEVDSLVDPGAAHLQQGDRRSRRLRVARGLGADTGDLGEDGGCHLNGLDLEGPGLRALVPLALLLHAGGLRLRERLGVGFQICLGVLEVVAGRGQVPHGLPQFGALRVPGFLRCLDEVVSSGLCELVCTDGVGLGSVRLDELVLELCLEALQHLHDAARLEGVPFDVAGVVAARLQLRGAAVRGEVLQDLPLLGRSMLGQERQHRSHLLPGLYEAGVHLLARCRQQRNGLAHGLDGVC